MTERQKANRRAARERAAVYDASVGEPPDPDDPVNWED